jgi:serine phosphatase RsbU (regulator of sigma subunit)
MSTALKINEHLSSKDLFEAFKIQLAKDFEQSNFDPDFIKELEPDFSNIHKKIIDELHRSEKKADSHLMQLLNRIDISEAQLQRYLREQKNQSRLSTIGELIIKRVLQKVVIKHHYRQNKSDNCL